MKKYLFFTLLALTTSIIISCIPSLTANNRLANTKWQSIDYQKVSITFGQNSFSFINGLTIISGSYTTSGDTVNFTYFLGSSSYNVTGALIGNELTAFGYVFRRVE